MRVNVLILSFLLFVSFYAAAQNNQYLKGQIAFEKAEYNQAVSLLNTYLNKYPANEKALLLRAKANLELQNYQQVIDDLDLLKITYDNEIVIIQARAAAGLGKNELSLKLFDKYLNKNKKLPEPILQSYPEFQELKLNAGWINLWESERYSKKEILLNNAYYAIKSKRNAEADDRLDELLQKYKNSHEAYYLKGKLLFDKKEYKKALEFFENAVNLENDNVDYLLARAECNTKINKKKKAVEQFSMILISDSLNLPAYLGRAEAFLLNDDFDNAERDIANYLAYYPENSDAQYLSATIKVKKGDFLSGISTYGKLIKSNPAKADYFIGRANSYMATKTYKYAIKDYSMALDLEPKNIQVYKQKASAHKLAGEMKKACLEWQHAAKLGDIESTDLLRKYCRNQ